MKIFVLSFSPTGTTRRVAQAVGEELAAALGAPAPESIPFTRPAERVEHRFAPQDIVVAAFPVYAGRLPNKLLPECKAKLFGSGTPVVPVCTFGNRSCDEALREQVLLLEENGFRPVGPRPSRCSTPFRTGSARGVPTGKIGHSCGNLPEPPPKSWRRAPRRWQWNTAPSAPTTRR